MVVTPKEARERNLADNAGLLKGLEKKIDKAMVDNTNVWSGVCIDAREVNTVVLAELKRIYGNAGWNVEYENDQRDGDFIRFTPKGDSGRAGAGNQQAYGVGGYRGPYE